MSLVAYDSSDESEEELSSNKGRNLITSKCNFSTISKKQRETVRITIPSLEKFNDEENEEGPVKKPKLQSGSGLFSLLPPPKYSSPLSKPGFIPKVLTKKKEYPTASSVKHISSETKHVGDATSEISVVGHVIDNQESDESDHETSKLNSSIENSIPEKNYFSLHCSSSIDEKHVNSHFDECVNISIPSTSDDKLVCDVYREEKEQFSNEPFSVSCPEQSFQSSQHQNLSALNHNEMPSASNVERTFLADEGFRKLQGRHREVENIDIIDVNADDQLTSKNEWLMKSLTEEKVIRPARKKHNMPTQQQKRKHQITYLAFQAKERELDLKNQWALNSRTRRETQAKYGF